MVPVYPAGLPGRFFSRPPQPYMRYPLTPQTASGQQGHFRLEKETRSAHGLSLNSCAKEGEVAWEDCG